MDQYLGELSSYKAYIDKFTASTEKFDFVQAFNTSANFQLMKLPEHVSSDVAAALLLIRHGVYVRSCGDKIGLDGDFLRVAIRTESENERILDALADILG